MRITSRSALSIVGTGLLLTFPLSASGQQNRIGANPAATVIAGAIDFHVHSYPDAFGRSIDDLEVARVAARRGMRAIVLKNHVTNTADRAALVMHNVPNIEVFGGIALNRSVGGLNAEAVEAMARMAGGRGKVVWLPTIDAQYYTERLGTGAKAILPGEGIRVAVNGQLVPAMTAVLERIRANNLVLQTGHVSPDEVLAVVRAARAMGIESVIVTHAMARVPGLTMAQMTEVARLGGYIELVYLNHLMGPNAYLAWTRDWDRVSITDMANAIKAIGAEHFIVASDLGASGLPVHPDGLELLVTGLEAEGIPRSDLELMMRVTPAKILGLDPR